MVSWASSVVVSIAVAEGMELLMGEVVMELGVFDGLVSDAGSRSSFGKKSPSVRFLGGELEALGVTLETLLGGLPVELPDELGGLEELVMAFREEGLMRLLLFFLRV